MSTPLTAEDLNAVEILFTGQLRDSGSFSHSDCYDMAAYLKRIHDCYYAFYDGISPFQTDVTQRILLPCLFPIASPLPSQLEWRYGASAADAAALKSVQDILLQRLLLLSRSIPQAEINGGLECFRHYGMAVIEMPSLVKNQSTFTELYPHSDSFKSAISEVQLWLHFFEIFCDLLGTVSSQSDTGEIDIASVRGSKLIRAAHSFYMSGGVNI